MKNNKRKRYGAAPVEQEYKRPGESPEFIAAIAAKEARVAQAVAEKAAEAAADKAATEKLQRYVDYKGDLLDILFGTEEEVRS